jgi:zinc transport system substrate-binding protein
MFGLFFFFSIFIILSAQAAGPLQVAVAILPQKYFCERIGGGRVHVTVLVPPGKNHETYEPTPRQITDLTKARIFFRIGLPLENALLPKLHSASAQVRIVDCRQGIALRQLEAENQTFEARHGSGGNLAETADPHIWLSPVLVQQQAATMLAALSAADPAGKIYYETRCRSFIEDLTRLHARLTQILKPVRGGIIFVYHPAYGYFTDAYGLKQKAVELEGKEPAPQELARFIKLAKQQHVRVIFVQPQFSQRSAQTLAQTIGAAVIPMDPVPYDYMRNLTLMAEQIDHALKP